jgi:hypothetical protein
MLGRDRNRVEGFRGNGKIFKVLFVLPHDFPSGDCPSKFVSFMDELLIAVR